MEISRLPFRLGGLYGGCAKLDGLIIVSPENLTLEYRMTDNLIGAWGGPIVTRSFVWRDLERAECGLGFFSPWLALTARSLSTFDQLPCTDPCRLKLGIAWKHRRQLRTVSSEINLHLSYQEADRLRRRLPEPVE